MKIDKVYHVRLTSEHNGKKDYFFGSLAAIYSILTPEIVGCKVENLWNKNLNIGDCYDSGKCTISVHELHKKSSNRGKYPRK